MPFTSVMGAQSIIKPGVATSGTRPASPFNGQVLYETDTAKIVSWNGSAWVYTAAVVATTAIFNETQASGTEGGTFTGGSYVKRTLNTTVINNIVGCTLTASVISLPAGTYEVSSSAPAFRVDRHKSRLQNTSDAATLQIGSSEFANVNVTNKSFVNAVFTLAATKNIELQHRCETTMVTQGLGVATSFGDSETYATITITKVA